MLFSLFKPVFNFTVIDDFRFYKVNVKKFIKWPTHNNLQFSTISLNPFMRKVLLKNSFLCIYNNTTEHYRATNAKASLNAI